MRKSRKFKKAVQDFSNEAKSFSQFCSENGIEVENKSKSSIKKRNIWIGLSASFATAAIVVCCCIPLMRQNTGSPEITYYGDDDVGHSMIDYDLSNDDYMLFDLDNAIYTRIDRIFPNGNENITLGFTINNGLYGEMVDDSTIAFEFNYLIRCDYRYLFNNIEMYDNLSCQYTNSGVEFSYGIVDSDFGVNAYITYSYNKNDYYIRLWEYENITEINSSNIEIFIDRIICNQEVE